MKGIFRTYLPPAAAVGALYALNRWVLIPCSSGTAHRLLAWHGADLLAGALMLCVVNAALEAAGRQTVRRFLPASAFLLGCGWFWEYVTPLYLSHSVSDPRDMAAAWLGGMVMLIWMRRQKTA